MWNHQAKPIGSNVEPEAHATTSRGQKGRKKCHGHGKRSNSQPWAQGQQSKGLPMGGSDSLGPKAPNFKNKGKAQTNQASIDLDMYYHCGSKEHWSCTSGASPHNSALKTA